MESNSNIIHVLKTHGILARWYGPGQVRVRDEYVLNGRRGRTWRTIPATYQAVYEFLGY